MAQVKAKSEVTGTVWKVLKQTGESFEDEEVLMIIESMKMEIPVTAEGSGAVISVLVAEGASVSDGDTVMLLDVA